MALLPQRGLLVSRLHSEAASSYVPYRLQSLSKGKGQTLSRSFRAAAKKKFDDSEDSGISGAGLLATGTRLVDSAAALIPESVPRPMARGLVGTVGVMMVFGLVQKVLSGVITLAVLAGLGYYFFLFKGGDDGNDDNEGGGGSGSKRSKGTDDDLDDPLSDARRIMDKYR